MGENLLSVNDNFALISIKFTGPRECFVPRPGRNNWHLDYSQIEMRFFVHFAKDRKMAKAIDADIHLAVACEIYNLSPAKVSSEQRKRAKMVNFGIIYGAGAKTLTKNMQKKGLDATQSGVTTMLAAYHHKYPSVRRLTQELKIELIRKGYITNPFGRRYHIPTEVAYKGINNLVQGTSADEMKRAMLECWLRLRKDGYRTKLIMTIHDELVFEIPKNEQAIVPAMLMKIMEKLDEYFVPLRVEAKVVTDRWSKKEDPKKLGLPPAA
jgi:DNA polymerase-1